MDETLQPTRFIDSDHPAIREFVQAHAGDGDDRRKAVNLYYAFRDYIPYNMRDFCVEPSRFVASNVLQRDSAFCIPKAVVLAALNRAVGIPARLGFADVRNHLIPENAKAVVDDEVFRWHAYTALYLEGRWVKATPAFNIELCRKHGVKPLEFDGREDSIFHPYDEEGRFHMEYVRFRGEYDELPFDDIARDFRAYYPRMLELLEAG